MHYVWLEDDGPRSRAWVSEQEGPEETLPTVRLWSLCAVRADAERVLAVAQEHVERLRSGQS